MTRNSNNSKKTRAKCSSSETLFKRSAPDTDRNGVRINGDTIVPELISDLLTDGHKVKFRAPGDSMYPTICDGDEITVSPIETSSIAIGDIILYQHRSGITAHRVMHIIGRGENNSRSAPHGSQNCSLSETLQFFLRGDAAVVFDDPVGTDQILGKVTLVEREGRRVDLYSFKAKIRFQIRRLASSLKRFFFEHRFSFPI